MEMCLFKNQSLIFLLSFHPYKVTKLFLLSFYITVCRVCMGETEQWRLLSISWHFKRHMMPVRYLKMSRTANIHFYITLLNMIVKWSRLWNLLVASLFVWQMWVGPKQGLREAVMDETLTSIHTKSRACASSESDIDYLFFCLLSLRRF